MSQSEGSRRRYPRKKRIHGRKGGKLVITFPKRGTVAVPNGFECRYEAPDEKAENKD